MHVHVLYTTCITYTYTYIKLFWGGEGVPSSSNAMEVEIGLRVARGPDWQWGDEDGGEGCL